MRFKFFSEGRRSKRASASSETKPAPTPFLSSPPPFYLTSQTRNASIPRNTSRLSLPTRTRVAEGKFPCRTTAPPLTVVDSEGPLPSIVLDELRIFNNLLVFLAYEDSFEKDVSYDLLR